VEETHNPLAIVSINSFGNPYNIRNSITSMNVTLNYHPQQGESSSIPVFFRIYMGKGGGSGNGLLWGPINNNIGVGKTTLTIYPLDYTELLPDNISFRVIAYYGNYQSSFAENGKAVGYYGLNNPGLFFPVNQSGTLVPYGWNYFPDAKNMYSFSPGNVTMSINTHNNRGNYSRSVNNPDINVSRLANNNVKYIILAKLYLNTNETNINSSVITNISFGINLTFDYGKMYMLFESNSTGTNAPQMLSQSAILIPSLILNFTEIYKLAQSMSFNLQSSLTNLRFFINERNDNLSVSASFYDLKEVLQ
jgi:hypothetical protein